MCMLCWASVVPDYLAYFTSATLFGEVLLVCILRYGRRSSLERWYYDAIILERTLLLCLT